MTNMEKKFTYVCVGTILLGILLLTVGIKSCYTVINDISDRGLKSAVEEVWEGKQNLER